MRLPPTQARINPRPRQAGYTETGRCHQHGKGIQELLGQLARRRTGASLPHRSIAPSQVYAKAFADAAATPAAGADAAPEPAPGPEPIGPAVSKETDAAKEIQILKDRLDQLQKVIDEQSQGGGNAPAAPPAPLKIPEPLSAPDPAPADDKDTPFATMATGAGSTAARATDPVIDTKFVTRGSQVRHALHGRFQSAH